jgi:hypothetical protein
MKREFLPPWSPAGDAADWAWPLAFAERACCCPARPVVTVVMPPALQRPYSMDLLLCGHHYQTCEIALLAAGATVYDETGVVLPAGGARAGSSGRVGQMIAAREGGYP